MSAFSEMDATFCHLASARIAGRCAPDRFATEDPARGRLVGDKPRQETAAQSGEDRDGLLGAPGDTNHRPPAQLVQAQTDRALRHVAIHRPALAVEELAEQFTD